MSDFDERLSAVLTAEADHAPHPAGLAQAARHRHVVRRRRRVAVGGVAAALVVAAPVALLAGGGDGDDNLVGNDDDVPGAEWRTARDGDVRAEIPRDWDSFTCDFDGFEKQVFGPSQEEACGFETYLAFYGSDTYDAATMPGEIVGGSEGWGGYVYASDLAVSVSTLDRDLTRRILASAGVEGGPEIDGSAWETQEGVDLKVEVPARWGLGPNAQLDDYAVCAVTGDRDDSPDTTESLGIRLTWVELDFRGGRWITVSAPTQAVAQLVLASVEWTFGSDAVGCIP